jgi:hypothetical protein
VYVGGSSLIDSDGPGVHAHNLQRLLIPKKDDVLILRSKNASLEQEEVTNKALEDIRISTREDIQTFEQLDEYFVNSCDVDPPFLHVDPPEKWAINVRA